MVTGKVNSCLTVELVWQVTLRSVLVESDWKLDKYIVMKTVGLVLNSTLQQSKIHLSCKCRKWFHSSKSSTALSEISELNWRGKKKKLLLWNRLRRNWKEPWGTSVWKSGDLFLQCSKEAVKKTQLRPPILTSAWRTNLLFNALCYLMLALEASSGDKMKNQ